jgi:hypothetical protein
MYCRIKSDEHAADALRGAIARLNSHQSYHLMRVLTIPVCAVAPPDPSTSGVGFAGRLIWYARVPSRDRRACTLSASLTIPDSARLRLLRCV